MVSLSVGKTDKHRKLPNLRKDQTKSQTTTHYKLALNPCPIQPINEQFYGIPASTYDFKFFTFLLAIFMLHF